MTRLDRLIAILLLLQSKRILRAQDIADYFKVSVRTVYRDVQALCEAGLPVAAEAGAGYSLVDGHYLPPVMFTRDEVSALFLGAQFVQKLTDEAVSASARSALLKIESLLPRETSGYLERLQRSVELFLSPAMPDQSFQRDTLVPIQEAIVRRGVLFLEYHSNHNDTLTEREVEPLGLLYYANHWHLIAFCRLRQDYRDFRADRIRQIRTTGAFFAPDPGFSLQAFIKDFFELEESTTVRVKFDQRVASSVRDKNSFGLIEEKKVAGGVIMTFLVPDLRWIASWLLSYGTRVEVISPVSLRHQLFEMARALVAHHREK